MAASTVKATTLHVNCGGKAGLTSIGAALKELQYSEGHGSSTINVSGACQEDIVIQSIDRLTLNAAPGASINDASGGNLVTVTIDDSRDVAINGFTINGGAGGADALDCQDGSVCRLNGNTIQGAVNGYGVGVFFSQLFLDGGTLQNNFTGLAVINGASGKATNVTIQNNSLLGIEIRTQSFVNTTATITANSGGGVFVHEGGTLSCPGCQITGNGGIGAVVKRDSSARLYNAYAVTGNAGGGIQLNEESSAYFGPGTVTGNTGGTDVYCGSSYTTARFATTNIGGGTTNCVEPSP
jgi:Right handed beta helix region